MLFSGLLEHEVQIEPFSPAQPTPKGLNGSPIHQKAKNLYRELSTALGVQKQGH